MEVEVQCPYCGEPTVIVVDEMGGILGIISQADIAIRLDKPKRTGELVENISKH